MTPLEIYTLFVLPALLIVISGGFILYGKAELRKRRHRATEAEMEGKAQAVSRLGLPAYMRVVSK